MSIRQKTLQTLAMAGVVAMVLFLAGCGGGGSSEPVETESEEPMNDATTRNDERLGLFAQANGEDQEFTAIEDNPNTDVDESMTEEQLRMVEAMAFGEALADAATVGNGKPANGMDNTMALNPSVSADWAGGDDTDTPDVDESDLRIRIDPDGTTGTIAPLTTNYDEQGDPINFNRIDGLDDFMYGYEIWRVGVGEADPVDQAKAIVFTDKQQDTPGVELVTEVLFGSRTNEDVGEVTDTVIMFDVSNVFDNANRIEDVTYFVSQEDADAGDPGLAYTGTLTCPAVTQCKYRVLSDGSIDRDSLIGYRFTGIRTAREAVAPVDAVENDDYLAFGLWLHENADDGAESFGAFAGGGDAVRGDAVDNLDDLTGQATYIGKAFGAHYLGGMTSWFDADASITIDWDASPSTGTEWGVVMGEISNIRIAGGDMLEDSIYLSADGSSGTGTSTFTGTAAMGAESHANAGDYPFSGGWTGGLYSAMDGDYPDGVAGTFGVTNADESESYVGAFGTRLE